MNSNNTSDGLSSSLVAVIAAGFERMTSEAREMNHQEQDAFFRQRIQREIMFSLDTISSGGEVRAWDALADSSLAAICHSAPAYN
jgi:hypothetical protein